MHLGSVLSQMETKIVIIRHGETTWNAEGKLQGHYDAPLTDVGKEQARKTGRALATAAASSRLGEILRQLVSCVTSDLSRASDTADLIASELRAVGLAAAESDPLRDSRLRETHLGGWQGLSWAQVLESDGERASTFGRDPDVKPEGGESFRDRYSRATAAVSELISGPAKGKTVLVVSHGGVLGDFSRLATGTTLRKRAGMFRPNAAINVLVHSTDESAGFSPAAASRRAREITTRSSTAAAGTANVDACVPPSPIEPPSTPAVLDGAARHESTLASASIAPTICASASSDSTPDWPGRFAPDPLPVLADLDEEAVEELLDLCPEHLVALGGSWRVEAWAVVRHLRGVREAVQAAAARSGGSGSTAPENDNDSDVVFERGVGDASAADVFTVSPL